MPSANRKFLTPHYWDLPRVSSCLRFLQRFQLQVGRHPPFTAFRRLFPSKFTQTLQVGWTTSSCCLQTGSKRRGKHSLPDMSWSYPCVDAHLGLNLTSTSSGRLRPPSVEREMKGRGPRDLGRGTKVQRTQSSAQILKRTIEPGAFPPQSEVPKYCYLS